MGLRRLLLISARRNLLRPVAVLALVWINGRRTTALPVIVVKGVAPETAMRRWRRWLRSRCTVRVIAYGVVARIKRHIRFIAMARITALRFRREGVAVRALIVGGILLKPLRRCFPAGIAPRVIGKLRRIIVAAELLLNRLRIRIPRRWSMTAERRLAWGLRRRCYGSTRRLAQITLALGPCAILGGVSRMTRIVSRISVVEPGAACIRVVRCGHLLISLRTNSAKECAKLSAHFRNGFNTQKA
jgi:hypothetical protein